MLPNNIDKYNYIHIVKDGIFPIIYDKDGGKLNNKLDTGINVAGTIQGEGKLTGVPSIFIRLFGCNLRCKFLYDDGTATNCDTPHAIYKTYPSEYIHIDDIISILNYNCRPQYIKHIVITGGEPFMQSIALANLTNRLHEEGYHITIETNGTLFDDRVYWDLLSISPKLSNSTPWKNVCKLLGDEYDEHVATVHEKVRYRPEVLKQFVDYSNKTGRDYQLKFVITTKLDLAEIEFYYTPILQPPTENVWLMPAGKNTIELEKMTLIVLNAVVTRGYRFCNRLHVDLFGDKPGV